MSDSVHEAQGGKITIVGKWAFDIIYEFVYQFQEACQYREKAVRRHNRYGCLMGLPVYHVYCMPQSHCYWCPIQSDCPLTFYMTSMPILDFPHSCR